MVNNREAPESLNGFFYQRYCSIYYILNDDNYEYILEEGYEDIDLIKINKQRNIIQVKYYGNSNESLTINSGLYKVIVANFNKNDVDTIQYYAYNTTENIYHDDLFKIFENKKYYNIGKFVLLLVYSNILLNEKKQKINSNKNDELYEKHKINFNITNIDNINELYEIHKQKIKNKLYKTYKKKNNKDIYDFFNNENNCNNYFVKFQLLKGFSYKKLNEKIDAKISEKFNNFIVANNNENKNLKILLIKNTILNFLTDEMFNNIKSEYRQIKSEVIFQKINENIKIYTNTDNLYYELLKQTEKIIINSINNKNNKLNINEYIDYIKQFEIDPLENVSFCICLLNNYYNELNNNEINNIKKYLVSFIHNKIKIDDIDKYYKLYIYNSMIIRRQSTGFRIPHENLINIINNNHKINKYFN